MQQPNARKANGTTWRKWRDRMRAFGAPCAICHQPIDYSLGMYVDPITGKRKPHPRSFVLDHITPLAQGGANEWDNLQPAHWICNARKGDGTRHKQQAHASFKQDDGLPQPW